VINREEEGRGKREEGVSRLCDKALSDTRPKVRRLTGWYGGTQLLTRLITTYNIKVLGYHLVIGLGCEVIGRFISSFPQGAKCK